MWCSGMPRRLAAQTRLQAGRGRDGMTPIALVRVWHVGPHRQQGGQAQPVHLAGLASWHAETVQQR